MGTKLLPKLRSCNDVQVRVEFTLTADGPLAETLPAELEQIFEDLGIAEMLRLEK